MPFFNVIFSPKRAAGTQYLCGADERLAKETAAKMSATIKRGERVTLWSVTPSGQASQIDCLG
ncbi:hypothetical protein [Duganella vulcania]|uniref:Uncharacterized protein n=1 Tax=Duganella vulcania TaxID=2692166 RepID=A0A845GGN2_9BURK|nr:hypothetical protein [Duganella vulcania]MYM92670.1 hypothetical protein [Duganella vulcania]